MALIYLGCAWAAGVFLGLRFNLPLVLVFSGLLPLPLLLLRRHRKPIVLASLCLFALSGGALYSHSSLPDNNENYLSFYNKSTITIQGMVSSDPEVRDETTQLRLAAREIRLDEEWQEVKGDALLTVPRYPAYSYGNVLQVTGELETVEDSGYADYLSHEGILATMFYPEIKVIDTGQGFKPLEWLYSLRNRLSQTLAQVLPQPQASLAQGIILGVRSGIPTKLRANFSTTGTAHILAISGLHLAIIAGLMLSLGIWLFGRRRYLYIWLALGIIWIYALITGMQPPVVRSAIMVSVFLFAELLGRQRSAITALVLAAAIMVGLEPQVLFTASFQMSFLATAGLVFIFPRLRDLGRRFNTVALSKHQKAMPVANLISDSLSVTLGAILAVWPLVAYYFGIVSLVGPVATLFALPALPGIIVTGLLAAGLGLIVLPAAQVAGWLAWPFLSYLLLVVNGFASLPAASVEAGPGSTVLIWTYYPALALVLWLISNRQRIGRLKARAITILKPLVNNSGSFFTRVPRKWLVLPLLLVAILTGAAVAAVPDDRLHVSFLDVGQGDAILIQKGNYQVLVDGGPSPQAITLELGQKMPFWDRTIELVVLTHPHSDHLSGLVEVLNDYRVEQVLYPDVDYDSPVYDEWLGLIKERDIKSTTAQSGQQVDLDGVEIAVLNPPNPLLAGTESDVDNNSVVLYVSTGKIGFLLTGDLMWQGESELLGQRRVPKSTVLKVAHHGSNTSTTPGFLAAASPQLAVISVGADNDYGLPSSDITEELKTELGPENVYRTDEDGTIEFITDGESLWVKE